MTIISNCCTYTSAQHSNIEGSHFAMRDPLSIDANLPLNKISSYLADIVAQTLKK